MTPANYIPGRNNMNPDLRRQIAEALAAKGQQPGGSANILAHLLMQRQQQVAQPHQVGHKQLPGIFEAQHQEGQFRDQWREEHGRNMRRSDFTSLRDMFDGGGPGQSGDTFQGGKWSPLLNTLGVKPKAPNVEGMQDVAQSGRDVPAHLMQALMRGAPNYRHGTAFHPGGEAIVGEDGPERVMLPRGAQVIPKGQKPNQTYQWLQKQGREDLLQLVETGQIDMRTAVNEARKPKPQLDPYDQGGPASDPNYQPPAPQGYSSPIEPDEYMREEMGEQNFQRYQQMNPQQRLDFLNNPQNGFVPPAPQDMNRNLGYDARAQPRPNFPQEHQRFNDAAGYQTADLDAFKLMQLQPNYPEAVSHDANATEARRLQLLRRAMFADAALEDPRLARAMTKLDNNIAGRLGAVGRLYTGDDYELGSLMAEQFASAVLRGDSGAQTPEPEVRRYIKQYFPLSNETPEQVAAKKAMRREEIRAMIQSLPEDARPAAVQIQQEIDMLKQQADVPDGSLTGGAEPLSDDDKAYLKSLGLE